MAKIILTNIKNNLDNDHRFRKNVAYPQFSFRWKIAIDVYPSEPPQFAVEGSIQTVKAPGAMIPEGTPIVEIDIEGGTTVAAPIAGSTADAARREAGIPVPSPRSVKGPGGSRITVDAPNVDHSSAPKPPDSEEKANVEKGGKVFARSVTQRTKAAPEGVDALPQAGSKPTMEDVQKIIEKEGPQE
jgi:hypothetical protein